MKPTLDTNRVAYPDVSYELNDIVAQQAEGPQKATGVKRLKIEDARGLQSAGMTALDRLTRRGEAPLSPFGHVPKPADWNPGSAPFHDPTTKPLLHSAGVAMKLNKKLDEILGQVAGQITDPGFAKENIHSLLPRDFKGLQFKPEPGNKQDPVQFIQQRSLFSLDELRARLSSSMAQRTPTAQDSTEKATALLQLRTKLGQIGGLANFIDRSFADLDAIDLGKLKTPQLC